MHFPGVIWKISEHCVRMWTLLLDNCIFEYSVLYFAPSGLEVMLLNAFCT